MSEPDIKHKKELLAYIKELEKVNYQAGYDLGYRQGVALAFETEQMAERLERLRLAIERTPDLTRASQEGRY